MTLKSQIEQDFITAYKSKDETKVSVLRMVKSAIKNFEINSKVDASDMDVVKILRKELKQRQEAMKEFEKANRTDLIAKEKPESEIIESYLPAEMTDDDLRNIVSATIEESGFNTMQDMGKLIGLVMKKVEGQADGARISALVKELLNK